MWPKYKTEAKARKHTWKWFVPCNISEWWAAFKLQCSGNTHRIGKMHSITCSGSTFTGREGDSWAFFKAEDKGLGPMWSRSSQSSPTHVSMFWIICWRHHRVTFSGWHKGTSGSEASQWHSQFLSWHAVFWSRTWAVAPSGSEGTSKKATLALCFIFF